MESPVQLLNVLEWAHSAAVLPGAGPPGRQPSGPAEDAGGAAGQESAVRTGADAAGAAQGGAAQDGAGASAAARGGAGAPGSVSADDPEEAAAGVGDGDGDGDGPRAERDGELVRPVPSDLTVVVLSPHDPMTRGQLRRVAELARDEGVEVRWEDARGGAGAPLKTVGSLVGDLRRARRVVIGDPFSRYVQLLLTLTSARDVVVVDDGTATMEFVSQLAGGERLVRWHRKGSSAGGLSAAAQSLLFAPFARRARTRLTPGRTHPVPAGGTGGPEGGAAGADAHEADGGREESTGESTGREKGAVAGRMRRVEVFSSMPVDASGSRLREMGVAVTSNDFAWTRSRFGPPRLTRGTDLVGTSLVETGVVDLERYLEGVAALARTHGATRYFAHRRESGEKLHRVKSATGLEIVRPDLPLELVARRGPIGRTVVSFPSTVVHTLPLALEGTPVSVAVCDVDRTWFTSSASPRAEGFLSGVTDSARRVRRLGGTTVPGAARAVAEGGAEANGGPGSAPEAGTGTDAGTGTVQGTGPGAGARTAAENGTGTEAPGTDAAGEEREPGGEGRAAPRPEVPPGRTRSWGRSRASRRTEAGQASA